MNELKAGAALNYVTIVLTMVTGLVYTPYMLRTLGQSEYGLYSLAASVIAYLTVLDLGFGNAIVRYTAKFRAEGKIREQEEMFGMFLVLYAVIGVVAFVAGSILTVNADALFSSKMTAEEVSRTQTMLWLMTFNLAFNFPMSIWGSIMSAYERFIFQKTFGITRSILNPLVMVVLLTMGYKAVAMVVATTIFNVVTLLVNYIYCRRRLQIHVRIGRFNWGFLHEVAVYSFWVFLNAIMDRIYWSSGQFILGIYRGAAAIAIYAVAIQLQGLFMGFSTAISGVFLPRVTGMVAKGSSNKEISDLFVRTGRVQFIIMGFILSAFTVFGSSFIRLWAGADYSDAYVYALLFFVALTPPLIQNLGITILQARNQMKFRSLAYIVIALVSLVASILGAKYWGGLGCAIATSSALLLGQGLVMNIYYRSRQGLAIGRFWREISKMAVVPAIICGLSLWGIHQTGVNLARPLPFLSSAIAFTLIYGVLFWRFSMNESERELLLAPIRKLRR